MADVSQTLSNYGLPIVFTAVFLEQLGLPLPAVPWLLAVGALSATGKSNAFLAIGLIVLACLTADAFWFYLGRYRGNRVLGFLCRISLEPDSCVRRTQNVFTRYGGRGLVVAKFLPGLSTVAPPLAGMSRMNILRFLFFDGLGALLYGTSFIVLGYAFTNQIQQIGEALASIGGSALALIAGLAGAYIGIKYWQRHRLLRELRMARITVADLRRKQEAGETMMILDLRSSAALEEDPSVIPGAIHTSMDDIKNDNRSLPRDREIIVYCSCPNEASAARVALLLQRQGFTRVRPLLGGIDAWRQQNYPLETGIANRGSRGEQSVTTEQASVITLADTGTQSQRLPKPNEAADPD